MSQKTYMYDTQWQALINAIDGGDTSAIATALGQIKTSVDGITTALGSLSTDVTQDTTQWSDLINAINGGDTRAITTALETIKISIDNVTNAISNQTIEVDFTNLNSNAINNLSILTSSNITGALNILANTMQSFKTVRIPSDIQEGFNLILIPAGVTIGTVSMPINMRGFALKNSNVVFAIISSYDGLVRYTIHSDRNTWNINPKNF